MIVRCVPIDGNELCYESMIWTGNGGGLGAAHECRGAVGA